MAQLHFTGEHHKDNKVTTRVYFIEHYHPLLSGKGTVARGQLELEMHFTHVCTKKTTHTQTQALINIRKGREQYESRGRKCFCFEQTDVPMDWILSHLPVSSVNIHR